MEIREDFIEGSDIELIIAWEVVFQQGEKENFRPRELTWIKQKLLTLNYNSDSRSEEPFLTLFFSPLS